MSVTNADVLKGYYNGARALGNKSINSDAWLEIVGFESLGLLTKQFPWPTLSPAGEIEVVGPLGITTGQPQQLKVFQQGQMALSETVTGMVQKFLEDVIAKKKGVFDVNVYEGTPDRFYRGYKLRDCFFQVDNPDRDWENRSQITMINGTLFFHFFGEKIPGNIIP
jgi:hypothetical protein